MKRTRYLGLLITLFTIAGLFILTGCNKDNAEAPELKKGNEIAEKQKDCCNTIISSLELTEDEINMLLFVREEEKMARDVYLYYSEKFNKPIFKNIAKSEQAHMEAVLCLLLHFEISDPALPDTGLFTDEIIQGMYNDLISLGTGTIVDAMTAGANIEDFDIEDINTWMSKTENEAILSVFSKLVCGSGNHLISFCAHLEAYGVPYVPVYISVEEYEYILSEGHQFCGR